MARKPLVTKTLRTENGKSRNMMEMLTTGLKLIKGIPHGLRVVRYKQIGKRFPEGSYRNGALVKANSAGRMTFKHARIQGLLERTKGKGFPEAANWYRRDIAGGEKLPAWRERVKMHPRAPKRERTGRQYEHLKRYQRGKKESYEAWQNRIQQLKSSLL